MLDGTENESAILGIAVINPNIDALQEFKVSTSNYDAEFGAASGALIQATTKSGTNQWHGSAFEFLRNDFTNATNPFTQINPALRWNQFGGSVGAPIVKDKLFGFFDYQGTKRRTGGSVLTTVPTAAERSGDLSALLGNYICADGSVSGTPCGNPLMVKTTEGTSVPAQAGMVFNPNTGDPATGLGRQVYSQNGRLNVLPVAAPMQKLLALIPQPNTGGGNIFNNYISNGVQAFDTDQYDGRVDYNMNARTHLFGRYTLADYNNNAPAAFGASGGGPSAFAFSGDSIDRNQSLAVGLDHTVNPNLVTDGRFGFYRYGFVCSRRCRYDTSNRCRIAGANYWISINDRVACLLYQRQRRVQFWIRVGRESMQLPTQRNRKSVSVGGQCDIYSGQSYVEVWRRTFEDHNSNGFRAICTVRVKSRSRIL